MQRAKAFFYVCAGVCLLAFAYHLGATSAIAQQGGSFSGFTDDSYGGYSVITSSGDVFTRGWNGVSFDTGVRYVGNFWSGGPVPTTQPSWGQLKARYR